MMNEKHFGKALCHHSLSLGDDCKVWTSQHLCTVQTFPFLQQKLGQSHRITDHQSWKGLRGQLAQTSTTPLYR